MCTQWSVSAGSDLPGRKPTSQSGGSMEIIYRNVDVGTKFAKNISKSSLQTTY